MALGRRPQAPHARVGARRATDRARPRARPRAGDHRRGRQRRGPLSDRRRARPRAPEAGRRGRWCGCTRRPARREIVGSGLQGARLDARRRPRGVHRGAERARDQAARVRDVLGAPDGHVPHGPRPRDVGREPVGRAPRHARRLDRRRVGVPDGLGHEPDGDDHGARPPHGPRDRRAPEKRQVPASGSARHLPHAGRALREPARVSVRAALPRVGGPAARPHRRGRGAAGRLLPRRADLVVSVAQGDPAGARRRLSLRRARLPGLRALGQADRSRLVLVRPPRRGDAARSSKSSTCSDAVAVVHDWGGPIGLRLAIEHPDRFSAIVVMDTGVFTGHQEMSDAWKVFRDFVERTEDLPISMLVSGGDGARDGRRGRRRLRRAVPRARVEGRRAGRFRC